MSDRMSLAGSIVEYMGESVDVHIHSYRYFDILCTLISYVDEYVDTFVVM